MDPNTNKKFLFINSANRLSGTSNAFSIAVQIPTVEQYDCCVVTQASIPVSYYLVVAGLNTFQLNELTTTVTITIPPGNYNLNSFSIVVANLLNTSSPHSWTYSISYPSAFTQNNTGLLTFTVTGNSGQPSFIFNSRNYLNQQFGFNSGSTVTFSSNTLVSTNVCNFINESLLYIHSDIVSNGSDDVLQEIYSSATQTLSTVTYQCNQIEGNSKLFKVPSNQVINIYLTDENNIPINLNGQDMQLTLLLYKKSDFQDMVKEFIKYIAHHFANQPDE
jgi:hypothetical protein